MFSKAYFIILIIHKKFYLTIQCLNIIHLILYNIQIPIDHLENYEQENLIEMSMDHNIEPCNDFYGYACNNYQQQHDDPNYDEITGLIDYELNKILINLIETKFLRDYPKPKEYQTIMEKTSIYYDSCRRERQRNVTKYFEDLKPGYNINWPILEEVKLEDSTLYEWPDYIKFDFLDLLGELQSYGLNNVLINQEIIQNEDDSYHILIEPAFVEERGSLPKDNVIRAFLMGFGLRNPQKLEVYLRQIKSIDKEFSNIIKNYTQTAEIKEILFKNLHREYPNLNLNYFLQHLIPSDIENHTLIIIKNPEYFQHLNDKLWQLSKKQQLCNYLMFKFLYYLAVDSTPEFSALDCIKDLRNKMDLSVNYLYYDHIYKYEAHVNNYEIIGIIDKIMNTISEYFQKNNLNLTIKQIEKLQEKLQSIQTNIGNLPENVNLQKIEKFYENLPNLDINNYYKNHLLLLKHRFVKSLNNLQNETFFITTDNHLGSSSAPVYIPQQNMIIIPFGSLQLPLFHFNYHPLFKWSLMGFILAHEFTHAFDSTGLQFNGNGLPLDSHSDILDNENFRSSQQCMQQQQSTDSIDERIADLFAIRVVYKIYENTFKDVEAPFLNLDWKQVFFLNLAQFFCGKKNIKFIDHDADSIRLKQIVMNFQEFSEAFQCPAGSKMNPKNKCRLY